MSFGPEAESIVLKLIEKQFTRTQRLRADISNVNNDDVARVELKLWIDFCKATGGLSVNDGCIAVGRKKFHRNIIKVLNKKASLPEALENAKRCTIHAGVKAKDIVGDSNSEVSVEIYEQACTLTLIEIVEALKKLSSKKELQIPRFPLCDDVAKKLLNKK